MRWLVLVASLALPVGCEQPKSATSQPAKGDAPKVSPGTDKPAPTFPPADWTHKELVAHLAQKGVKVEVSSIPLYSSPGQPASYLNAPNACVVAYLCPDARAAREKAGSLGTGAFAIGRFAFEKAPSTFGVERDDADLLARIQAALK